MIIVFENLGFISTIGRNFFSFSNPEQKKNLSCLVGHKFKWLHRQREKGMRRVREDKSRNAWRLYFNEKITVTNQSAFKVVFISAANHRHLLLLLLLYYSCKEIASPQCAVSCNSFFLGGKTKKKKYEFEAKQKQVTTKKGKVFYMYRTRMRSISILVLLHVVDCWSFQRGVAHWRRPCLGRRAEHCKYRFRRLPFFFLVSCPYHVITRLR